MAEASPQVPSASTPPPAVSVHAPVGTPAPTAPVTPPAVVKPPGGIPVPGAPEIKAPAEDPRVAQLMAKERALVKMQQELKTERERLAELDTLRNNAKRDPEGIAKKLWGDDYYEQFTNMRLSGNKVTPDLIASAVDEKLASFEKRQADLEAQRVQAEQKRVVEQWREDTREFVKARGEEYELINHHGWQDTVIRTIEDHFEKTQKILSAKEAADIVEQYLEKSIRESLGLKKFAAKAPEAPKPTESAQPRTLTNAATAVTAPGTDISRMSDEDRIQRAIAVGEAARKARSG